MREFFDPSPEQQNVVLVAAITWKAEGLYFRAYFASHRTLLRASNAAGHHSRPHRSGLRILRSAAQAFSIDANSKASRDIVYC